MRSLIVVGVLVLACSAGADEEKKQVPLDQCPVDWKSTTEKLGPCMRTDVTFRNGCDVAIDVKICLGTAERADGWFCGASLNIEPNAGWHWATCGATGEKKVWVKKAHDYKHGFPKFP